MAVPTFLEAKIPVPTTVTSSEPITPSKVEPLIVAAVVPSYILVAAIAPMTDTSFGVILAVKLVGCVNV